MILQKDLFPIREMEESELSPAIKRFCGSFPVLLEKEVTVAEAEKIMIERDAVSKSSM